MHGNSAPIEWSLLGDDVRDRFDGSVPHLTFRSAEVRTEGTATGCYMVRLLRLLGTAFPAPGQHRRAEIDVDVVAQGVRSWRRAYVDARGRLLRLDTVKTEEGGLIEERSGVLAIVLRPSVSEGRLVLTSERFDIALGRMRIPLPEGLTPGRLVVEHRHEADGGFTFDMRLVSPCLGEMFVHTGRFKDVRNDDDLHDRTT